MEYSKNADGLLHRHFFQGGFSESRLYFLAAKKSIVSQYGRNICRKKAQETQIGMGFLCFLRLFAVKRF
jgi:hypothetical protein